MQVTLCEQLASYLTKFKPAAQSTGAAASSADVVVPQGMQVLKKKGKQPPLHNPFFLLRTPVHRPLHCNMVKSGYALAIAK